MYEEIQRTDGSEVKMPNDTIADPEVEMDYSYAGYVALGGRIDEENYSRVMKRVREESQADFAEDFANDQTKITADISGISLDAIRNETGVDPRFIYGILRHDIGPDDVEHHHGQMSDQQLLVESLRMLEQGSAAQAIIARHPHIQFN